MMTITMYVRNIINIIVLRNYDDDDDNVHPDYNPIDVGLKCFGAKSQVS